MIVESKLFPGKSDAHYNFFKAYNIIFRDSLHFSHTEPMKNSFVYKKQ